MATKMVQRHIRIPKEMDELLVRIGERRGENLNATFVRMMWEQIETETGHKISKLGISQVADTGPKLAIAGTDQVAKEEKIDPRHAQVRELIMKCHLETFKQECPWGPGEAGQLGQLLKAVPNMTVEELGVCVRNVFRSEGAKPERPMNYLANLTSYGAGPLDKFGKTKRELKPAPVKYLTSRYDEEGMRRLREANEE